MNYYPQKIAFVLLGGLIFSGAAFAQGRLSDDMIPPDVTLTDKVTTRPAVQTNGTAPGLTGTGASNFEVPAFTGDKASSGSSFAQGAFSGMGGAKNPFNNPQFASQMDQLIKSGKNVDAQKLMELQQQMQLMGMPNTPPGQPKNPTHFSMMQQNQGQNQNTQVQPNQPFAQGQNSQSKDPVAVIETSKGTIVMRLFRNFAPKTVQAFIQMSSEGFYNGLNFHRYEPGFVIQGGCPKGNGTGLYIDRNTGKPRMLALEVSPALRHNAPGVVAMARSPGDLNSASCQFYITLAPKAQLDQQYTVFGGVVQGMDVVNNIRVGDKIINIQVQEQN